MRAGKLDRTITLQSYESTVDDYGTPVEDWTDFAKLRAQIVQQSTEEFIETYGQTDKSVMIFRTRYKAGVTTEHRVMFGGDPYNIREIKEIGRHRGLEIRCEVVRS
ncbi:phage head closure protein [Pelagibacterium halotolerans]|uniref:phage head closure protein n=1 Tax=Pelagibacterium halotolerans TaxID=531813 RepID=UPI00384C3FC3